MQAEFQNLKISITDEVHLKAVCDVLESMGYDNFALDTMDADFIATGDGGLYTGFKKSSYNFINGRQATLTDLLQMRDNYFREAIK